MASGDTEQRRWRTAASNAGRVALPLWFAAAGLALGVGGVVRDQPIAGACGAVAGVAGGLLWLDRSRSYRAQYEALRVRLREIRAEADAELEQAQAEYDEARAEVAQLRQNVANLQNQLWETQALMLLRDPATGGIPVITGSMPYVTGPIPIVAAQTPEQPARAGPETEPAAAAEPESVQKQKDVQKQEDAEKPTDVQKPGAAEQTGTVGETYPDDVDDPDSPYLSTSPTTKKVDPRIATMSEIRQPGNSRLST
jgi:hypothetical protein